MRKDEAMSLLVEGLSQQNLMKLDALGIHTSPLKLPEYERYQRAARACYGTGRLGKFYAKWLRPLLAPKKNKILIENHRIAGVLLDGAHLNLILEQVKEKIKELEE